MEASKLLSEIHTHVVVYLEEIEERTEIIFDSHSEIHNDCMSSSQDIMQAEKENNQVGIVPKRKHRIIYSVIFCVDYFTI